jgi:hypothetical protein
VPPLRTTFDPYDKVVRRQKESRTRTLWAHFEQRALFDYQRSEVMRRHGRMARSYRRGRRYKQAGVPESIAVLRRL